MRRVDGLWEDLVSYTGLLSRDVKRRRTLALADLVIESAASLDETAACFPGDDLFTPYERRRGLPLGNQTS